MEEKKVSRREFLKKSRNLIFGTLLTSILGHTYGKYIEPRWIQVTRKTIKHPLISNQSNGIKIVQFGDTHLGFHFSQEDLQKTVQLIMDESPDIIIFSGDLVDNLLSFMEVNETILTLNSLNAPLGKYAVFGNHDHGGWGSEKYWDMMSLAGFSILQNDSRLIKIENVTQFAIVGVDDAMLGKPNLENSIRNVPKDLFTILISHAPDLADEAKNYPFHWQISGHTHGGQVQLPLIGPLVTPPYGNKYVEGHYKINDNFSLYVNRGLGTTRLPYRFLARPEITIYTLQSENS